MDILQTIWDGLSGVLGSVMSFLMQCAGVFFFWLPDDPFADAIAQFEAFCSVNGQALGWLNWFFPVQLLVSVLALLAAAAASWIGYLIAMQVFDWIRGVKQTINPGG